jgi:hypothetical protein
MMEEWNIGIMGKEVKKRKNVLDVFLPRFHHSIFPIFRFVR